MRAKFRLEITHLTNYEQALLANAYRRKTWPSIRNECRNLLSTCIKRRLQQEYPVMQYALMWIYKDHVDVYIPTAKLRQHSKAS